jgi:hypothetical protein
MVTIEPIGTISPRSLRVRSLPMSSTSRGTAVGLRDHLPGAAERLKSLT